ncbi:DUF1120 domain-containing protein [Stenotrophomonas sp. SAU14A_NAIMI4_8]|uniref:DUF1120 domain-containing protein n=1 Tax=Stenotrophomonas sp. SAU14A_NAIMI4_8 TaxID=2072409 RepID=UPI00131EEB8B|nr:DUF1120 domain-containing protein [Stenotrophomonas sp. SAU14A_NAIMI4_8]
MNRPTRILAASALSCALSPAFAADSVTMKVGGTLVAPSCNIALSDATVDFGDIARGSLGNTSATALPASKAKTLNASVACVGNTAIAISTVDNSEASKPTDIRSFDFGNGPVTLPTAQYAGLGRASNNAAIGAYAVRVGTVTVGTVAGGSSDAVKMLSGVDTTSLTEVSGTVYLDATKPVISAADATGNSMSGNSFNFPLTVAGNISATDNLPAEEIDLNGSTTIEVKYL